MEKAPEVFTEEYLKSESFESLDKNLEWLEDKQKEKEDSAVCIPLEDMPDELSAAIEGKQSELLKSIDVDDVLDKIK